MARTVTTSPDVTRYNYGEFIYIKGNEFTDGSKRICIDSATGVTEIQKRVDGVWQPASLELGPHSLWVGPNVGVAGVGHHLATESSDGHLHFHAHSEFDGEASIADVEVVYAHSYTERQVYSSDESGNFTGTNFEYAFLTPISTLIKKGYFKTHTTGATQPIRVQIWQSEDDTGNLIFSQTYPASIFPVSSEAEMVFEGYAEFTKGLYYFTRISSDETFSLKTNSGGTVPWQAADVSLVREESLLQTKKYVDGDTYASGQYLIQDRKIYICNTAGVQTGDFASNSDKWDLSGERFIEGIFTEGAVPYAGDDGRLTEDPTNLFYDDYGYLHAPGLAIPGEGAILKIRHGLSLSAQEEVDFDIVHINTLTKSAYFKYDAVADEFSFDKRVAYDADYSDTFVERSLVDKNYSDYKSILAQNVQSTGLTSGMVLSKASDTTLDISAGTGYVAHYSDPATPVTIPVDFDEVTGYTPTNLATDGLFVIGINENGGIVEINVQAVSAQDGRDNILIGVYIAISGVVARTLPVPFNIGYGASNTAIDFIRDVIGPANVIGNLISANGTNLSLNTSGGTVFIIASNFRNNPEIPDELPIPAGEAFSFFRVYREASPSTQLAQDGSLTTFTNPDKWDDSSGTLADVPINKFTVQVVYATPGVHYVVYGQEVFNRMADAESALLEGTLSFDEYPTLQALVQRSFLVVKQGTTDLSNSSNARFFDAGKFRVGGVSTSGGIPGINIPGSPDTSVQFNDGGIFGGDSDLTWDKINKILALGEASLTVNSIEIVGSDGEVNKAAVEDSGDWDTAYGWGDHSAEGYLTSETDPVFTAWDRSTGISITESQISDLIHYDDADAVDAIEAVSLLALTGKLGIGTTTVPHAGVGRGIVAINGPNAHNNGPHVQFTTDSDNYPLLQMYNWRHGDVYLLFDAYYDSTGLLKSSDEGSNLVIQKGQGDRLRFRYDSGVAQGDTITWNEGFSLDLISGNVGIGIASPNYKLDVNEIGNSSGLFKIQPDIQGDVELFGDTDVGDDDVGKILYVRRQAVEGDDYIRLYVNHDRTGVVSASASLTAHGEDSVTLHSGAENIIFRMGDDAGSKGTYFKNSSNAIVGSVDSLGNAQFNASIDVPEIFNIDGLLKIQPYVHGDVELFGDTDVANNENSKIFKIWRRASEGNDYIRFYLSANRQGFLHASCPMNFQAQVSFTINSVTDDIFLRVGDNAGSKKFYFQDSDNLDLMTLDSNAYLTLKGDLEVEGDVGFYGTSPVAQQTGVAVTASAIHIALVNLGLITA